MPDDVVLEQWWADLDVAERALVTPEALRTPVAPEVAAILDRIPGNDRVWDASQPGQLDEIASHQVRAFVRGKAE